LVILTISVFDFSVREKTRLLCFYPPSSLLLPFPTMGLVTFFRLFTPSLLKVTYIFVQLVLSRGNSLTLLLPPTAFGLFRTLLLAHRRTRPPPFLDPCERLHSPVRLSKGTSPFPHGRKNLDTTVITFFDGLQLFSLEWVTSKGQIEGELSVRPSIFFDSRRPDCFFRPEAAAEPPRLGWARGPNLF